MKVRRKEYYSFKKCLKFYKRAIEYGLLDHQKKSPFGLLKVLMKVRRKEYYSFKKSLKFYKIAV